MHNKQVMKKIFKYIKFRHVCDAKQEFSCCCGVLEMWFREITNEISLFLWFYGFISQGYKATVLTKVITETWEHQYIA